MTLFRNFRHRAVAGFISLKIIVCSTVFGGCGVEVKVGIALGQFPCMLYKCPLGKRGEMHYIYRFEVLALQVRVCREVYTCRDLQRATLELKRRGRPEVACKPSRWDSF